MNNNMPEIGNRSDVGRVRKANEDYFGTFKGDFGTLVVVCDGMGGHKGGSVASRVAVEVIKSHFESLGTEFDPKEELKNALIKANATILQKAAEDSELTGMGSTAVLLLIQEEVCYYAHVGDSRIYHIRSKEIKQITKDHSLVQQMVDAGMITEDAAKNHPKKNVITRALGSEGNSEPEVSEELPLCKNDKFLLCSDGLTGFVEDNEILKVAEKYPPQAACEKLVDMANERGGKDNITVQIARITAGPKPTLSENKKTNYLFYTAIISFIVALVLFFIFVLGPSIWQNNPGNVTPAQVDTLKVQGNQPAQNIQQGTNNVKPTQQQVAPDKKNEKPKVNKNQNNEVKSNKK
ncbi:MAG: Stp1/IreP family PP2C-type Ser/Thr phosphatase [Bacteroidota bacterium]|nr:Stp1/IreP family PP2C-type Ser/Thr phosphatase [Bacteroidota bacterium]